MYTTRYPMNIYYPAEWVQKTSDRLHQALAGCSVSDALSTFVSGLESVDYGWASSRALVLSGIWEPLSVPSWVYLHPTNPNRPTATDTASTPETQRCLEQGGMSVPMVGTDISRKGYIYDTNG